MTIENFMMLLCGLGLFLYGMKLMGDGLELAAGSRLKTMIERLTTNNYMGALIGLAVTAVIQSSSATHGCGLRKCRIDDFGAGRRRDHGRQYRHDGDRLYDCHQAQQPRTNCDFLGRCHDHVL